MPKKGHTEEQIWAVLRQVEAGARVELRQEIASAIAKQIRMTLTPGEQIRAETEHPVNVEAYESYWRDEYFLNMAANPVVPIPELQMNTEKKAEGTIVHGSGRITSATSDLLQRTIRGLIPGTKRIVLDLAEVDYIDSSGLGALVSVYLAASRAQCVLELANPKPRIRDLFELSRLKAVFESHGG